MFTVGGRLMDRFGSKKGLAASVGVWSVANSLHGIITNFYQLVFFRFLLGVGEGGCFPGAAKAVYEWFSEKNRALANGIAIGGSAIGAVIAPPLTIFISSGLGWRWSFVIPGLIGILWVAGWLLLPSPGREGGADNEKLTKKKVVPFSTILKNRQAQTFIIIRFLLDPVLYFIMFWTPKYLHEQRNVAFEDIGKLFWVPFLALGLANVIGGFFSDKLVKRGVSINRARKTVMGVAAAITLVAPFIAFVSSAQVAVALMAAIMFAHGFWITNYITSISDIFGGIGTSTVVGLSGTAGAISGLLINPLIGIVVQSYSYTPIWVACGLMYPVAFVLFLVFVPKIQSLVLQKA